MEIVIIKKFHIGRVVVGKRYKVYDTYCDMQKNYEILDEEYNRVYIPQEYCQVV